MKKTLKSICAVLAVLLMFSVLSVPAAASDGYTAGHNDTALMNMKKTNEPTVTFTDGGMFAVVDGWYDVCGLFQNFQGVKSGKVIFTYNPLVFRFNEELSSEGTAAQLDNDDGISYSRTFPEAGRMEIEFSLSDDVRYRNMEAAGISYFYLSPGAFDVLTEGELDINAEITDIEYYEGASERGIEKRFYFSSDKSYKAEQLPFIGEPVLFPKPDNLTVAEGTTVREYIDSISAKNVIVTDAAGNALSGNDVLRTGAYVESYYLGTLVDYRVVSVMGDVNMDGAFNASDARYLLRAVTGLEEELSAAQKEACGTYQPTAETARALLRQAAGLE